MTSIRIETATNSRPVRPAAAPPATTANVLHFCKQKSLVQTGATTTAGHVTKDYGPCRLARPPAVQPKRRGNGEGPESRCDCQGSREFPRCDHGNSPPWERVESAGRMALMASRWARIR